MTDFIKLNHKLDLETVKKLNGILEGSGWTVGKIFLEAFYLESDIKRAKHDAYYSEFEEAKDKYGFTKSLEDKQKLIYNDLKEEENNG